MRKQILTRLKNFHNNESGNIALTMLFFLIVGLCVLVYVILYYIIDNYILPLGVASGANTQTAYQYGVSFWQFFPFLMFIGVVLYTIINGQKQDLSRGDVW